MPFYKASLILQGNHQNKNIHSSCIRFIVPKSSFAKVMSDLTIHGLLWHIVLDQLRVLGLTNRFLCASVQDSGVSSFWLLLFSFCFPLFWLDISYSLFYPWSSILNPFSLVSTCTPWVTSLSYHVGTDKVKILASLPALENQISVLQTF